jgi:hypothetical protein
MESNRRQKRRSGRNADPQDELENYPFFTHSVKDLYFKFVDETAVQCKKKCVDEFVSTRLIFWEATNLDGKSLNFGKNDKKEEVVKAVSKLANDLFDKIRSRTVKNILLKSYNYFLIPMQTDLWGEIQGNITCLGDEELQELFEVPLTKDRLSDAQKDMQQIVDKFTEQEDLFMEYANNFSKGASKLDL